MIYSFSVYGIRKKTSCPRNYGVWAGCLGQEVIPEVYFITNKNHNNNS